VVFRSGAGMVGLVTGARRGIGRAVARRLSGAGAKLVLADLPEPAGDAPEHHGLAADRTLAVDADVRRLEDIQHAVRRCRDAFGRVDFVVANAGTCDEGSLAEGNPDVWRAVVETNLLGVAHTVRAVLPAMQEQGSGHIVLMASVSGREAYEGQPMYVASKWGVVGLGYSLRRELAPQGIKVTLVEPGLVDTELSRATAPWAFSDGVKPLDPDDVARAVAFAILEPPHVTINEIVLRPRHQAI
jgi:NADP-dependent 3-hydroxy acid dehydrogenase YdfG